MTTPAPEHSQTQKIPFLEWLWLQHSFGPQAHFYPLAHLVLDGGPPPTSPWKNKTSLNPLFVKADVEALYATGRPGVTLLHTQLAHQALTAYAQDTTTITQLVDRRSALETTRPANLQSTITTPFREAGFDTPLSAKALHTTICTHTDPDSLTNCRRPALPGDTLCSMHGGTPLTPQDLSHIYKAARTKLIAATEMAVDVTIELATSSPNDEVRRKAAEMILDRTGLIPGSSVTIQTTDAPSEKSPAEILLERIQRLAPPDTPAPALTPTPEDPTQTTIDEIIEGELVPDAATADQ